MTCYFAATQQSKENFHSSENSPVVDNAVILELKSVQELNNNMEAQLINYLKLSKIQVGYLINFQGARLEWKRFVCQRE